MGAAGYVTVYNEADVRAKFTELWPNDDIDKDWWYLKTCSAEIDGTRFIFDYSDDQGQHEGTAEDFWFSDSLAQDRVRKTLWSLRAKCSVEVWT